MDCYLDEDRHAEISSPLALTHHSRALRRIRLSAARQPALLPELVCCSLDAGGDSYVFFGSPADRDVLQSHEGDHAHRAASD